MKRNLDLSFVSLFLLTFLGFGCIPIFAFGSAVTGCINPALSEPNSRVSVVILDKSGNNLQDDVRVRVMLPNGDSIPVVTSRGFFSVDLSGLASPDATLKIELADQSLGEDDLHIYIRSELKLRLQNGQNAVWSIDWYDLAEKTEEDVKLTLCVWTENDQRRVEEAQTKRMQGRPEVDSEPLIKAKTPLEKAQRRLAKQSTNGK